MVALAERPQQSGQELLAEFIQYGHQKPFEEIVRRYAGMVFNVCLRVTKDKHEAEDATQAVFLTLALQARRGADIKALGPWLQQVAKRLALDTRRSKKRRKVREERHHDEQTYRRISLEEQAIPPADLDELKTILHEELQKLPAKYRLPLILHYFGGMSRDEMAAELNCKASTLGVRIFRGREMLAGRLSGRGVHLPPAVLAVTMAWFVKHVISDALIASTTHAATAIAAGHSGAGYASAHVIGLTHRATSVMLFGKVKLAAVTLLLVGTSLGAGAKALGVLPQINVQQIFSDQLQRLMRPLIQPLSRPLRVDARAHTSLGTVATSIKPTTHLDLGTLIEQRRSTAVVPSPYIPALSGTIAENQHSTPSESSAHMSKIGVTDRSDQRSVSAAPSDDRQAAPAAVVRMTDAPDLADASGSAPNSVSSGGSSSGLGVGRRDLGAVSIRSNAPISYSNTALAVNDLQVGSSSGNSTATGVSKTSGAHTGTAIVPPVIVQVAAVGGTVTESGDAIRGWGRIDRTGNLQNDGKIIADGLGIDRTLNLTSFTSIQAANAQTDAATATASSASSKMSVAMTQGSTQQLSAVTTPESDLVTSGTAATSSPVVAGSTGVGLAPGNGWYAVNHGRLSLGLKSSPTEPSVLTWGDDPSAISLSLVNSVRISLTDDSIATDTKPVASPDQLALLATDRTDAPDLFEIDGAPIGVWEVGAGADDISAADLTVRYNDALCNELGGSQSSLQLWTLGSASLAWAPASSTSVNLNDHLVSGFGEDISYFAVSIQPAPGRDVADILAHPLTGIARSSSSQSVPEPTTIFLLPITTGLLGRRARVHLKARSI